jgi:hypothetical protein
MFIDRKEILSLINFCPTTSETNRLLAKFGILSGEFNFFHNALDNDSENFHHIFSLAS